jgi:GTP-binding protein
MLGVVRVTDYQSFVMADIPGIIEGAHHGKGLGLQFLRHIQRTSILLFLIDVHAPDPVEAYRTLRSELVMYDPFMEKKPHLIALSKLDTVEEGEQAATIKKISSLFKKQLKEEIIGISAVSSYHIAQLKRKLYDLLQGNK